MNVENSAEFSSNCESKYNSRNKKVPRDTHQACFAQWGQHTPASDTLRVEQALHYRTQQEPAVILPSLCFLIFFSKNSFF